MTRLERTLESSMAPVEAPACLWNRVEAGLTPPQPQLRLLPALAASLILVVTCCAGWYWQSRIPSLEAAALQAHRELSDHPERLDAGIAPIQAKAGASLELLGGRLLGSNRTAVRYRVDGFPATLILAQSGGDAGPLKVMAAHSDPETGLRVFLWRSGRQDYALVSSAPGDGRRACVLCHA